MRKERKIINTNIRLNLCDEQDRQAWEYLQTMDREKYKSYTRAVVVALNDYFSREYRNEADPYLETREKEDAFLERVETAVRDGVKESVPMAIAKNLMEMLVPFVKESVGEINLPDRTLTMEKTDGEIAEDNLDWEKEADMDAALDFADSFASKQSKGIRKNTAGSCNKSNRRFEDSFCRGSGRTEKIEPDVCRYSQSAPGSYYKYQSDCKKAAYRWRSSK